MQYENINTFTHTKLLYFVKFVDLMKLMLQQKYDFEINVIFTYPVGIQSGKNIQFLGLTFDRIAVRSDGLKKY